MENSVRKEAKPGRGNDIRRHFLFRIFMQAFFYLKRKPHQSYRFWKLEHSVCIETVALPPVIPMCSALHRRSVL